jgi:cytochrome c-type biogenesis protein CcmH
MKKLFLLLLCTFFFNNSILSDEYNGRKLEIYKNLRCLVCQGQSIADSNSDFAQTLKLVVHDQIKKRKSNKEIYNFLISKYGDWIVYKPQVNKNNLLLWAIPYLVLLIGGIIIFILSKKRKYNGKN